MLRIFSRTNRGSSLLTAGLAVVLIAAPAGYLAAKDKKDKKDKHKASAPVVAQMDESKKTVHALNRLTFGPRPGDVERVSAMGVDKWIDQQLNPEKIDDSALQARLEPFRTLKMDNREMVQNFPPPQVLKAIADGRAPMPSDPKTRATYESALEVYKARQEVRQENKDAKAGDNAQPEMRPPGGPGAPDTGDEMAQNKRREEREAMLPQMRELLRKPANDRMQAILKMDPAERRKLIQLLNPGERERLVSDMSYEQRETLLSMANPQGVVTNELTQAKLLRAIYSERQLEEVMTDFWFNHFNVYIAKGADRYLTTAYERDTIRKHSMGKFEDLLVATAKDPAMLFYLDNFQSIGPNSMAGQRFGGRGQQARQARRLTPLNPRRNALFQQQQRANDNGMVPQVPNQAPPPPEATAKRGINENYARELMELHTLGVDGGYTQKDIQEVAKVFTGWTVRQPRLGGDYEFNWRLHEPGSKVVLGQKIDEGGEGEGRKVLHLLATQPATAKFISKKLAMRFVSDNPPQSLIDNMAATFLKSDGDIKQVLRTMFKSQEFWAQDAYRAKVKTPLEFVVSAVRITGADVKNPLALAQTLNKLGMPLYGAQPPTGYSMKADAWVNSAALLNRMNFALALAGGQLRGLSVSKESVLGGVTMPNEPEAELDVMTKSLVAGDVSKQTLETIRKQMDDPQYQQASADEMTRPTPRVVGDRLGVVAGLILGSPEFQRR